MALVIKLRPRERLLVNGALIRNASDGPVTLHLLNRANVLHEKDILLPDQVTTALDHLYLSLQNILLEAEDARTQRSSSVQVAARIYAEALSTGDAETCALIDEVIRVVGEDNVFRALRLLKPHLSGGPGGQGRAEGAKGRGASRGAARDRTDRKPKAR